MPPTSKRCVVDVLASPRLLPDLLRAARRRACTSFRVRRRRNWLYRRLLSGPLADHIVFHPCDLEVHRLEDADALLRGRFRFYGEMLDIHEGSVFDAVPPSPQWHEALQSFAWLPPLSVAGGDSARHLATKLIAQWVKRHGRYSEPAWAPHIIARRLLHLFSHGRMVIVNSDMLWRSKLFVSVREQTKMLARIAEEAPQGLPRLEAAAALTLSGICLDDNPRRLEAGLALLETEIARQILPDGGHIGRAPETLAQVYRLIVMVMEGLNVVDREVPPALRSAYDRMAPMLRFFRHGDGGLALFHGGKESNPRMIAALLARDEVRGQPFTHARHSGYQRLAAGRTLCILDCGGVPPGDFARQAHASCLALEMSSAAQRIIVNCGAGGVPPQKWEPVLRATAAHSTVTLCDTSSAVTLPPGWVRTLLGPRLLGGPQEIVTRRDETAHGWCVAASHDAYLAQWGVLHERRITLSPQGTILTGADRLVPVGRRPRRTKTARNFALRFHIHPDIRVSRLEGGGALLKLANGEGWRFRCGGEMVIEDSVYLGGETVRRSEQLVVSGRVDDEPIEVAWVFEQITS
jgi:uncharacterized heparinase superfamily protein